jgi:hypothetical protein
VIAELVAELRDTESASALVQPPWQRDLSRRAADVIDRLAVENAELWEALQDFEADDTCEQRCQQLESENADLRRRVPPDGWVAVGWLTECVWEDGTSYSFSYNEPKPIPTSTGMISQRIGRAYFDTARPNPEKTDE